MKKGILILLFTFTVVFFYGQKANRKSINGSSFNSVFQNLLTGTYKGTTNGVLILEKDDNRRIILDFQGSFGQLNIKRDKDEVYDISTKSYTGKTTSGKTEIKYETYGSANSFQIKMSNNLYKFSLIDGACDLVIDGLNYTYYAEDDMEYLVIYFDKVVELSNWNYIIKKDYNQENINIDELRSKERIIKVLPNSTITFAIKR